MNPLFGAFAQAEKTIAHRCVVCDDRERPLGVGVFFPEDHRMYFGSDALQPGRQRAIFYKICAQCASLPDAAELVETKMLKH